MNVHPIRGRKIQCRCCGTKTVVEFMGRAKKVTLSDLEECFLEGNYRREFGLCETCYQKNRSMVGKLLDENYDSLIREWWYFIENLAVQLAEEEFVQQQVKNVVDRSITNIIRGNVGAKGQIRQQVLAVIQENVKNHPVVREEISIFRVRYAKLLSLIDKDLTSVGEIITKVNLLMPYNLENELDFSWEVRIPASVTGQPEFYFLRELDVVNLEAILADINKGVVASFALFGKIDVVIAEYLEECQTMLEHQSISA